MECATRNIRKDGCVQGLLEVMGIPYTGSSVQACAISMDKRSTKMMLHDTLVHRIPIGFSSTVRSHLKTGIIAYSKIHTWRIFYWCLICHNENDLRNAYTQTNSPIFLLEKFIEGEEITVAVFEGEAYPVVSIRPKRRFFDLEAKYTKGKTEYIVPSPLSDEICTNAQKQAIAAYNDRDVWDPRVLTLLLPKTGDVYFFGDQCPTWYDGNLTALLWLRMLSESRFRIG